jgi:Flp pilus assembly protein TadD
MMKLYKYKLLTLFGLYTCLSQNLYSQTHQYIITDSSTADQNSMLRTASNECSNFDVIKYNEAKDRIEKNQDANYYYNTASSYVKSEGEASYNAIVHYEEVINLAPHFGAAYSDLGNCWRSSGCFSKANILYTQAIDRGFNKHFVYYNRAICRFEIYDSAGTAEDISTSKRLGWNHDWYKLDEKYKDRFLNQGRMNNSSAPVLSKEKPKFMDCQKFNGNKYALAKSKVLKNRDASYYYNTAKAYLRAEGETSYNVIAHYEAAIRLRPSLGGIHSDLGNCWRSLACYAKAEYCYTQALERGFEKGFVYYNRAVCRYERGDIESARSDFYLSKQLGWSNDWYKLENK